MANYDLGTIGYGVEARGVERAEADISKLAASLMRAERQYNTLDKAFNKGKISLDQYGKGVAQVDAKIDNLKAAMNGSEVAIEKYNAAMTRAHKPTNRFGMYAQQVGYQVGDFFVQVQSGTNALVAFGQQGTQLAGLLPGVWGAIFGIGLSMATAIGGAIMRTKTDMSEFGAYFGTLEPVANAVGRAFADAGTAIIDAANAIINNLDRVLSYATALAAFFGVRYVAALVAAAAATFSLSGALTVLRGALIRTGIGALIVAAGELIYQFTRLVKGAGGFGEALVLIWNVGKDVWDRLGSGINYLSDTFKSAAFAMQSYFGTALANMLQGFQDFTWKVADGLNNLFGTNLQGANFENAISNAVDIEQSAWAKQKEAQASAEGSLANMSAPLASIEAIREVMAKADEEGKAIDIRDWFGGSGKDKDGAGGGKQDPFEERLSKLMGSLQVERDTIDAWYEEGLSILADRRSEEILGEEQHKLTLLGLEENYLAKVQELKDRARQHELGASRAMWGELAGLLSMFGQKSKAAAVIAIGINTALRVAEITQNTAAAIMRAYAELGPIAGSAAAAKIAAMGKLQAGIAIAAGVAQGAGALGGGGGGGSGRVGSVGNTGTATAAPATPQTVLIQGISPTDMISGEQLSELFDNLYKENNNRGMVFMVAR